MLKKLPFALTGCTNDVHVVISIAGSDFIREIKPKGTDIAQNNVVFLSKSKSSDKKSMRNIKFQVFLICI